MATSHTDTTHVGTRLFMAFVAMLTGALAGLRKLVVSQHNTYAKENDRHGLVLPNPDDAMGIVREARMFGAAVVVIAITVLVVNEVLTVDAINNSSGPFTQVITDLETTGVAAMGLLVVGLLVVAGRVVMGFMGGNGGGGF
jgi:hypothetical protein